MHHLPNVAPHPHWLAIDHRLHCYLLHQVNVNIQVLDDISSLDIAKRFDCEGFADRTRRTRVMDKTHIIINRNSDIFLSKLLWRHLPVTVKFLVFVVPLPIETGWWCAEVNGQNTVNGIQNLILRISYRIKTGIFGCHIA